MQPGVGVGDHIDQTTALGGQGFRDRLAGQRADGHQQVVSRLEADRDVDGGTRLLPGLGDDLLALHQLPRLQQQSVDGIGRIRHLGLRGATGIHAVLTIGRGIQGLGRVTQQTAGNTHLAHHALEHPVVTQVGIKTGDQVQLAIAADLASRRSQ